MPDHLAGRGRGSNPVAGRRRDRLTPSEGSRRRQAPPRCSGRIRDESEVRPRHRLPDPCTPATLSPRTRALRRNDEKPLVDPMPRHCGKTSMVFSRSSALHDCPPPTVTASGSGLRSRLASGATARAGVDDATASSYDWRRSCEFETTTRQTVSDETRTSPKQSEVCFRLGGRPAQARQPRGGPVARNGKGGTHCRPSAPRVRRRRIGL